LDDGASSRAGRQGKRLPTKGDGSLDHYMEWVEASSLAYRVKSWTTPVKVFGYITVSLAAIVLIVGVVAAVAGLATSPSAAAGALFGALVISAVLFLQGSLVLMIATYVQMRAQQTIARTSQVLSSESDGD